MNKGRSFTDRLAEQAAAKKKMLERAQALVTKPSSSGQKATVQPPEAPVAPKIDSLIAVQLPEMVKPRAHVRSGDAKITYTERTSNDQVTPQPWTKDLVNVVLEAADRGGRHYLSCLAGAL